MALHASARRLRRSLRHEVVIDGRHRIVTDEPVRLGGGDTGPAPHELLRPLSRAGRPLRRPARAPTPRRRQLLSSPRAGGGLLVPPAPGPHLAPPARGCRLAVASSASGLTRRSTGPRILRRRSNQISIRCGRPETRPVVVRWQYCRRRSAASRSSPSSLPARVQWAPDHGGRWRSNDRNSAQAAISCRWWRARPPPAAPGRGPEVRRAADRPPCA